MSNDSSKFHWEQGNKNAIEGIKLLFILNGASAVAILTFVGNAKMYSDAFVFSMVFFALGAVTGIVTMIFAYLTNLHYGNAEASSAPNARETAGGTALKWHNATYVCAGLGILFFMFGVGFAAYGIHVKPTCFVT